MTANPLDHQRAERFAARLDRASTKPMTASRQRDVFRDLLDTAEVAGPDEYLWDLFARREVIADLVRALASSARNERLLNAARHLAPTSLTLLSGAHPYYQVRQLGPEGRYPNRSFTVRNGAYVVLGGKPYLVTRNWPRADRQWGDVSEMATWTRQETRLAATLACAEYRMAAPFLTASRAPLRVTHVEHVPTALRGPFMATYLDVNQRISGSPVAAPARESFFDFSPLETSARRFAHGFAISNSVLLRIGRTLVTSSMQWQTESFREDAFANVLVALEGSLMLLQDLRGGRTDRLDRRFLRATFAEAFEHGDGLFDWVDHALNWGGKRAQLVHPHLASEVGWKPLYFADDYYGYSKTVRALLAFIVAGEHHRDFEPPREASEALQGC